ncbi:MAG: carboxypeptidase regulatory-like domain-containing protein [candidate division Zixibacteria bacterium]|nr:carboxypeptidase regulatory-like domain-containing protein [candidate division Zixibacteria bacterium]
MRRLIVIISIALLPVCLFAQAPTINVFIGSPDGDTITVGINDWVAIPIYIQSVEDTVDIGHIGFALGINIDYIDAIADEGHSIHGILEEWAHAEFDNHSFENECTSEHNGGGVWRKLSFEAYEWQSPEEPLPMLYPGEPPSHILTYIVHISDRPELLDSVVCNAIGEGCINSSSLGYIRDYEGLITYDLVCQTSCARFDQNLNRYIYGTITDNNANPVDSARIRIPSLPEIFFTNSDGEYATMNLPAGSYDLIIDHPDYCNRLEYNAIVTELESTRIDASFAVEKRGAVAGIVTDLDSNPIAGIVARLTPTKKDTTDENGQYIINNICPGLYDLKFIGPPYQTVSLNEIQVDNYDTTQVNVEMCQLETAPDVDIMIWVGGYFDNCRWVDTMTVYPGMRLEIPVYFLTLGEAIGGGNTIFPLGINNAYIDSFGLDECLIHYPFSTWDSKWYTNLNEDYQTDEQNNTWDSYSFVGTEELLRDPP